MTELGLRVAITLTQISVIVGIVIITVLLLTLAERKSDFSARGENLRAQLAYNPLNPSYTGEIEAKKREAAAEQQRLADLQGKKSGGRRSGSGAAKKDPNNGITKKNCDPNDPLCGL